jgi:alpha-D-xyloside xylohydrolase
MHTTSAMINPGVWRLRLGDPPTATPVGFRELPPHAGGLDAMPGCPVPAWLDSVTWRRSRRGLVVSLPVEDDEEFFGLGLQLKSVAQRGRKKTLRVNSDPVADTGDSHAPVPFLCSTAGWGLLVDTARYATFHVACIQPVEAGPSGPGLIGTSTAELYAPRGGTRRNVVIEIPHEDGVELYAFGGPGLREAVARYNLWSGGGCRPSLKSLGVWYRAFGKADGPACEALLAGIRADGIPCDVFGLEPGWQSGAYPCSFVWSEERFPDHRGFLGRMHAAGCEVNCWEHAFTSLSAPIGPALRPHAGPSMVMGGLVPDLTSAPARRIFTDHHRALAAGGIDGFKLDECDGSDFIRSPWSWPETDEFPGGLDGECMHSVYGISYQRAIDAVYREAGRRTLHSVRSSHALAAPYPFVLYSDLYRLDDFVRGVASASFSGLLWTPEVRDAVDVTDLIRRIQAVSLSPQALINAWYIPMPPWRQTSTARNLVGDIMPESAAATALVRDALRLRMRLLPYIDAAFARYAESGVPPCRALALDHPEDPACRACEDQWLLGEDVLVAPVLCGTTRMVVLPPGRWWPLAGGAVLDGGRIVQVEAPLAHLPVYVRDGAILPLAAPLDSIASDTVFALTAHVFGDGGRGCLLVEDDGVTLAGAANQVRLHWVDGEARLERTGTWAGRRFVLAGWRHHC